MLPSLAQALKVQTDALLGNETKTRSKRGPASQLQRSIERISELPKPKQRFVMSPNCPRPQGLVRERSRGERLVR